MSVPEPDRELVTLRGDLLIPILEFVGGVASGALGQMVADSITDLLDRRKQRPDRMEVEIQRKTKGKKEVLHIVGEVDDVLKAIRKLDKN